MALIFPLSLIVCFACLVEASLGFGSTILTLAFAVYWFEVSDLIAIIIPINLLISSYLTFKYFKQIDFKTLVRWVLPWAGGGFAGTLIFLNHLSPQKLRLLLGILITTLGLWQLARLLQKTVRHKSRPAWLRAITLAGAGITQGLFASGGPLMIADLAAHIPNKSALRSTLSCTWLVMNFVLFVTYSSQNRLTSWTLWYSGWLIPATFLGVVIGTQLHHKLPEALFRKSVYALLTLSGLYMIYNSVVK